MPTFKLRTFECQRCGTTCRALFWNYDPPPICAKCGEPMTPPAEPAQAHGVIGDDIPGGLEIRHAICHPDGTPKRYYSKSAIRDAARKAGWTIDGDTPKPRENREV